MAIKKVLCIGDSITGGAFCTSPEYSYQAQLFKLLRKAFPEHTWVDLAPLPSASSAYMGGIWALWEKNFRQMDPDIIVVGGIGDNDSSSAVASIVSAIGMEHETITFNAEITANRAYTIYDATSEEVVIPQTKSTAVGTRCIRGAMGTDAKAWAAGATVRAWDSKDDAGWSGVLEYILRDFVSSGSSAPVVLVGGQVFEALTGAGNVATASIVSELQADYPRIEYCPYATSDGTSLFAASASTAYTGPLTTLAENMSDSDLTFTAVDATNIEPGKYILITSASGITAPAESNSECMLVVSKAANVVTVEGAEERAKLGSNVTNKSFTAGDRVCAMSTTRLDPRYAWATICGNGAGAAGDFTAEAWGYDRHPNNYGYAEIAKSFYRGFLRVLQRTQGKWSSAETPFF